MTYAAHKPLTLAELRTYEPHLTLDHTGDYEATVLVFTADVASVVPLLPAGLQLLPQAVAPPGQHPLIVFAGKQRHVRSVNIPSELCPLLGPLGLCMTYLEAAVVVPFVATAHAATESHFCSVKIYLNQALPLYLGWLCGLPKILGLLSQSSSSFSATTLAHDPLLNLTIAARGPFEDPAAFPNFAALRPMLEQPHIGQLFSAATPLLSDFVCAPIDLKIGTAKLQPVDVEGALTSEFSTVLPPTFSFTGIDTSPLGAFRLRTTWELPPPAIC